MTSFLCCPACKQTHQVYLSLFSPEQLLEKTKQVQEENTYLRLCNSSLAEALAESQAREAWGSSNGTSIADLLDRDL